MLRVRTVMAIGVFSAVMMTISATVTAQNALGDGRILDNNLQLGSGGINQSRFIPDFRARNNIITGNVPGLSFFRDNVGYQSTRDFGDAVSDDDLFRFRAQSYVIPAGGHRLYLTHGADGSASVYRTQTAATLGQLRSDGALNTLLLPGDRSYAPIQWRIMPDRTGGASSGVLGDDRLMGTDLGAGQRWGVYAQPDGRLLEVTASPLLGLRQRTLEMPPFNATGQPAASLPSPVDRRVPGVSPDVRPDAALNPDGSSPVVNPARPNDPPDGALSPVIQPSSSGRIDSTALDGAIDREVHRLSPSAAIGLDLAATLNRKPGETLDEAGNALLRERMAQLESRLFAARGSAGASTPADPYVDLLDRIRAPRTGDNTRNAAGPRADESVLRAPTPAEIAEARLARARAMRLARGLPVEDAGSPSDPSIPAVADTSPDADDLALPSTGPLAELLAKLDYDLPAVPTLAGKGQDTVNNLLRQAEANLAAGDYFDAEENYRRALRVQPDHPLATVGLIHAQLGAALIRSAALNLRRLLAEHPELIAARYDARLLPPADRMKQLRDRLDDMIAHSTRPEPALMLAYLAYQTDAPTVIRHALNLAEARSPRDPILPLLRRIWIDRRANPAGPSQGANP